VSISAAFHPNGVMTAHPSQDLVAPDGSIEWLSLFVVRPVSDEGRRAGYERVPRVGAEVGTILRTATCILGKVISP
jgi:hypothetical protein